MLVAAAGNAVFQTEKQTRELVSCLECVETRHDGRWIMIFRFFEKVCLWWTAAIAAMFVLNLLLRSCGI